MKLNLRTTLKYTLAIIFQLIGFGVYAQQNIQANDSIQQKDIVDVIEKVFHKSNLAKLQDTSKPVKGKFYYSILPHVIKNANPLEVCQHKINHNSF